MGLGEKVVVVVVVVVVIVEGLQSPGNQAQQLQLSHDALISNLTT